MRYQSLEIYSGLLRAVGALCILVAIAAGVLLVMVAIALPDAWMRAAGLSWALFTVAGGLLLGLGALASGQLLCVWIDIEANTRTLIKREWDLDR